MGRGLMLPARGGRGWRLALLVALMVGGLLLPALATPTAAAPLLVANGDFETGDLSGWTVYQERSTTWFNYSGTTSPVSNYTIVAPPQGTYAATTDQDGPGVGILYQDLALPAGQPVQLSLSVYYANRAGIFYTPDTLSPDNESNQQYRIDIMKPTAAVTSLDPSDILLTVFRTQVGDPLKMAPKTITADLAAFAGTFVRLRIAEVDNEGYFQAGVDAVTVGMPTTTTAVSGTYRAVSPTNLTLTATVRTKTGQAVPDGGVVTFTLNGQTFTATMVNGVATLSLPGYKLASYGDSTVVKASYAGDGLYLPSQGSGKLTIVRR